MEATEQRGHSGPLVERDGELARIAAAVDRAAAGRGGTLIVEGPPGIGKTRLLWEARRVAHEAGLGTLSASASPLERRLALGVARQLLGAPPGSQAGWAAILGLFDRLVEVCADRPRLLVVDDVQWADVPSVRFLAYAARRLDDLPALLVVAQRAGTDTALRRVDHELLSPRALSEPATGAVMGAALGAEVDGSFAAAAQRACGGNPLLLRELSRALATRRIEPAAALHELERIGPTAVAATVRARLAEVSPAAVRLAEAAAILGDHASLRLAGELAQLGADELDAAVAELWRVNLLEPGVSIAFVHALVREALVADLGPVAGGEAHARAARLLEAAGAGDVAVAEHLLHTPGGGEPRHVEVLRRAARASMAAGDGQAAVTYLRRALAEPQRDRVGLLLELAAAEGLVDQGAAIAHAEEALPLIDDPVAYARAAFLLASTYPSSRPGDAWRVALAGAERLGRREPELRRQLLAVAGLSAVLESGDLPRDLLAPMRRMARADGPGAAMLQAVLAYRGVWRNVPAPVVAERCEPVYDDNLMVDAAARRGGTLALGLVALVAIDSPVAPGAIEEWTDASRRNGSLSSIGGALMVAAHLHTARGELAEAEADAAAAIELFDAYGLTGSPWAYALAALAEAQLERGDHEAATATVARTAGAPGDAATLGLHGLLAVRARVRAATGDRRGALRMTLALGRRFDELGGRSPALLPWRSRAALLAWTLGDEAQARKLVAAELALARAGEVPRAIGRALTAAGIVTGAIEPLEEARDVLRPVVAPLDQARAALALGEMVHRSGDARAARPMLQEALERAARCGAAVLEARVREALLAAGGRPRRAALVGWDALTAAERRVVQLAAAGRRNTEIADELHLAPRTVEHHLSAAYRKLGIRSRAQLAGVVGPAR